MEGLPSFNTIFAFSAVLERSEFLVAALYSFLSSKVIAGAPSLGV